MKKIKIFSVAVLCLSLNSITSAQQNITNYIQVYFNQPVDNSFSSGVNAIHVKNAIMDTIAAYINRAKYTVDIAQYDYTAYSGDTLAHVATAVNNAISRGVKVRWIYDGSSPNAGLSLITGMTPALASPDGSACYSNSSGIMHNKFVIVDVWDSLHAWVSTGSEDWSQSMDDFDYNNLLFIQSKVLARAYTNEFNIMWGDTTHGHAYNTGNSKFGICKPNSGTHRFTIGGSEVELYFSPSDTVNNHVISTINSADTDMYCSMYTFTETSYSTAFTNRHTAGVYTSSVIDQFSYGNAAYTAMAALPNFAEYTGSAIYHDKLLIVDPSNTCSNPMVLTGSMNWSYGGYSENDENTIIIHNDTIANLYLQSYAKDYEVISGHNLTRHHSCAGCTVTAGAVVNTNAGECTNTGKATATPTGGTAPYTYSWTGGNTNAVATGLSAGSYTVTIKDKNGCSATASITITRPTPVNVSASATANVSCHGNSNGSVSSSPSGGTSPYTYSWTGGSTIATETGLTAGTYTVTVKDKNGCSATASVSITQPNSLTPSAVITANVSCHGGNNGSASSTPSGGTSPYTYSWTGGSTNSIASGLSAGTYTVTVKDKNGCSATASITITQPTSLSVSATTTSNVSCISMGSASSTVSGGTTPYTYTWSGGNTNAVATGLSAGTYTLTVRDKNGCTGSASTTITQPANSLNASATITANVICHGGNNGSASSSVTGGATPYTYSWSGGRGTNTTATGLTAGSYTLTVTDKNGCVSSAVVSITQPSAISIIADTLPTAIGSCTGSAWVNVSGGVSPYTYAWTGGNTTDSISHECHGSYCCTVTDANGCIDSVCTTITISTGTENINTVSTIQIYPEPNTGYFTIAGIKAGQIIELYNYEGKRLSSKRADNSTMYFDISGKANGVYLLRIENSDGSVATERKIIKTQ
jgi:phosphatidylserine/phosphatidylglycerophosphate/cardiolipin synthase-like enzyme